jgi:hypothetical protein
VFETSDLQGFDVTAKSAAQDSRIGRGKKGWDVTFLEMQVNLDNSAETTERGLYLTRLMR